MKIRCVNWASQETDAEMDVGGEEISFFLFFSLLTNSYMYVLVAQSCPTLCNTINCSLPGFSVHGVSQASILEWVCHFLLQGSNPSLLYWQADSLPLSHKGSPVTSLAYVISTHDILLFHKLIACFLNLSQFKKNF